MRSGLTAGGLAFRAQGEYWVIAYEGAVCHLRDSKGLHLLAYLLQRPGEKLPAVLLAGIDQPASDHGPERCVSESPPATAERARVKVTRAIKAALQRIES